MNRLIILLLWAFLGGVFPANAQSPAGITFLNANGGRTTVGVNDPLPVNATATIAFPTIGAAVPTTGIYNGVNVAGTLRGWSGLSTGSIFPGAVAIVDASGNQITSFGGTNTSVSATGSAVPATATYVGINVAGSLTGWTGAVTVSNTNANGQATMANSSPVVLASNQSVADPCTFQAKTNLAINQNGTSSVQLIALSGSTSIYICSLALITNSTATTVALTTGTGTACVTGNAAVIGATTTNIANSINLIAGAGLTYGNGSGTVGKGAASSELCMILGANVFVSGNLTYVQQ